jgi:hypothetical protein
MIKSRPEPRAALRRLRIRLLPVPSQAFGLAVLTAVLGAALVSAPLMVASTEQGAWQQERDRLGDDVLGATLLSSSIAGRQVSSPDRITRAGELHQAVTGAAEEAGLAAPVFMTSLRDPLIAPAAGAAVQLISRRDAEQHVDITAGGPSDDGVLVPQKVADAAGVGPGDHLLTLDDDGATLTVLVSGVYADPVAPLDPYWDAHRYRFLPLPDTKTGELEYPPPVLLARADLALSATDSLSEDLFLEWYLPLPARTIAVAEAHDIVDRVERLQALMADPESAVTALVAEQGFERPAPRSALPTTLATVDRTIELLSPPVRAVGVGGGAAALVLIGAWAGQRARRREDELRFLAARGLSPARGGWDAVQEALLPVLAGTAIGGVGGWLLVRELGPSADLPASAVSASLLVLGAGALAALAAVAVITAVQVARLDNVGSGQTTHLLGRVPWLAVVATLTVVTAVPLLTRDTGTEGAGVGILTLVVPLLVTVLAAGLVTAVLPRIGRRADNRLRRLPPGVFLALRRVLAGHGAARLVVVTTALSLALVVFAGALADSTARTIESKSSVANGSDVVFALQGGSKVNGPVPDGSMLVGVETDTRLLPGDIGSDILVVHPEQVADVVRWDDAFADRPLPDLMAALSAYDGDRVPVVLAGPVPDAVLEATDGELTLDFEYYSMPIAVVGRADAFPGQGSRDPLVVADWDRYAAGLADANRDAALILGREVWARGGQAEVLDRMNAAGYTPGPGAEVHTAAEFAARPELTAQTWALSYLRAIALAAAVLGLVGMAMHALAQQRRRTIAALLLGRMGLRKRSADASSGLEIGLLAGLAGIVAIGVALPVSALVLGVLDPVPTLQPAALFAVPWSSIAVVAAGVVVVTLAAAVLVGRSARRATGGQVMRDAA